MRMDKYDTNHVPVRTLITKIRKRRAIWDPNNIDYHNRIISKSEWTDLANEMQFSVEDIKKKWRNLRDTYRREYRKKQTTSQWGPYKQLSFLADILQFVDKPSKQQKRKSSKKDEQTESLPDISMDACSSTVVDMPDADIGAESQHSSGSVDVQTSTAIKEEITDVFESEAPQAQTPTTSHSSFAPVLDASKAQHSRLSFAHSRRELIDEDEAFFDSLLPHISTLQPKRKLECRLKIQEIILQYAYGDDSD